MTISGLDHEENPPEFALNLTARAATLTKRGNYSEAEGLVKKSLEITAQALGTDHPQIATLLTKLGILYTVQHRYDEAEHHLRLSLKINEKVFGPDHLDVAANLEALAFVLDKELRRKLHLGRLFMAVQIPLLGGWRDNLALDVDRIMWGLLGLIRQPSSLNARFPSPIARPNDEYSRRSYSFPKLVAHLGFQQLCQMRYIRMLRGAHTPFRPIYDIDHSSPCLQQIFPDVGFDFGQTG